MLKIFKWITHGMMSSGYFCNWVGDFYFVFYTFYIRNLLNHEHVVLLLKNNYTYLYVLLWKGYKIYCKLKKVSGKCILHNSILINKYIFFSVSKYLYIRVCVCVYIYIFDEKCQIIFFESNEI